MKHSKEVGVCWEGSAAIGGQVRKGNLEEKTFEQRPEQNESEPCLGLGKPFLQEEQQ